MDELLIVLRQIQEQLEEYSKEIENAKKSNRKQDKEIEALKAQVEKILQKFDNTGYQIQKVNLKVEQLWKHLDNSWQDKLKKDMQKFVIEMTKKNYEFMLTVMEEKMDKERKKADFWYKLILAIFGTGGIVAIILNYLL